SIEATRSSKFAALYSATKAGLRAFGASLFEEVRKSDLTVVTINPDMTDTPFFDALRFEPGDHKESRLEDEDIADAIEQILSMRTGVAVTEYTIRPQRFGIVKK
ncbi:MAG: SDR family NAD(P)-dependent oxidoreductase, partial [Campylobacterota bacterium]|nr:SDR family NAD(P)-dependent oxidoreductase [Campylobacterota bacterium]